LPAARDVGIEYGVLGERAATEVQGAADQDVRGRKPLAQDVGTGGEGAAQRAQHRLVTARTRAWIHAGRKIRIDYRDEYGRTSRRVVWPVIVGYMENARMLAAWCELRAGFRHFRLRKATPCAASTTRWWRTAIAATGRDRAGRHLRTHA
jgi:predicted DNA-binding transcriptional regulator YafY